MLRTAALALLLTVAPAVAADRPNVLLILTDDQGWGDIHSHGNELLDTPNLDRLAAQGARFERFFVSPVCAPTRAAMLTGRYSLRCGVHGVTRGHETMRASEVTLAEALRGDEDAALYDAACFGKWHNGAHWPTTAQGQGFRRFAGFTGGHWNNYFDPLLPYPPSRAITRVEPAEPEHWSRTPRTEGYIADIFTDAAIRFIGGEHRLYHGHDPKPWFCYVPFNTPHWPAQVEERLFRKYKDRGFNDQTAAAYGMVENLDRNVGRLMAALDEWGQAENTIVLFLTDNGPNGDRFNGGMRGRKGSAHEGGVRVPCFVRYPAKIEPGTVVTRNAAHIDLLPTLCELCDVPLPEGRELDGESLVPLLTGRGSQMGTGEQTDWEDRRLFTFKDWRGEPNGNSGAVRTDRWRCVRDGGSDWALFDMPADPGETTDVGDRFPEVRDELAAAFAAKWKEVTADGFDPVPVPLRAISMQVTLPGHEATLKPAKGKGIRYTGPNGWANDAIEGWTDTDAYAVWPLESNADPADDWAVEVLYHATPEQVGSVFAVEIVSADAGDEPLEGVSRGGVEPDGEGGWTWRPVRVEAAVTEAFDPPAYPAPDRFPRSEAQEYPWKTLRFEMNFQPAAGDLLRLRAVKKPGAAMPKVKAVRLVDLTVPA